MIKLPIFIIFLPAISLAGTITTSFNPLGNITISTGTISVAGSNIVLTTHTLAAATAANTDNITTPGITTTGANLLIAAVSYYKAAAGNTGISDSKSNFWTALSTFTSNSLIAVTIYYSTSPTVGTGHTFTYSGSGLFPTIVVSAWSGTVVSTPFDVQNGSSTIQASSTLPTNNVTPSLNNELVVTSYSNNSGSGYSVNSGFTVLESTPHTSSANFGEAFGYLIQSAATAENPTWTNGGGSDESAANIATFKSQ